ncbi:hypothetical protein N9L19_00265 [bacterium]|nr:hypothetical protein [bacterium]
MGRRPKTTTATIYRAIANARKERSRGPGDCVAEMDALATGGKQALATHITAYILTDAMQQPSSWTTLNLKGIPRQKQRNS